MQYKGSDHTLVICAYKESPFLEECIVSLKKQNIQSHIILVTSTPNSLIQSLTDKYEIPFYINTKEKGITQDWNFGMECARTSLVTIAHQDDTYEPQYVETMLREVNRAKQPLIFLSNYGELREGKKVDENKLLEEVVAIHNRDVKSIVQEVKAMEKNENQNFDAISAQLGFSKDAQMTAVSARIANLIKAETDLKDIQDKYTALEIKYKGKEAELGNIKSELEEVKASLKKYQDAEKAAFEAEVVAMIDAAISAGKIEDSSKDAWLKMAHSDFKTVKATLDSIQAREKITETIAKDPNNVSKKEETLKTVEDKMKEDVEAVVGKVELKKF